MATRAFPVAHTDRRAPRGIRRRKRDRLGRTSRMSAPFADARRFPLRAARGIPPQARLREDPGRRRPRPPRRAAGSSSSAIGRRGSTTTSAWRSTASSSAGPCRADQRSTPTSGAWRCTSRTTRSSTSTSRASSPRASTAPATSSSGTGDVGARGARGESRQSPVPPIPDPRKAIEDGELKFRLDGEKLKGRFTIVKTKPRDGDSGEPWLLIHKKDDAASPAGTPRTTRRASRPAGPTTRSRPTATRSGSRRRRPPRRRST